MCTRMALGGTSELGLIGSVRESREEESDPLHIGSCCCECGAGCSAEVVDEMLAREEKNPPSFLVGGGVAAEFTAAGAEAEDSAGEAVGGGVAGVVVFQSLKPHRDETDPFRAT